MKSMSRQLAGTSLMMSPPALLTLLVWADVSRQGYPNDISLYVSLGVGVVGAWLLPIKRRRRALITAAFIPVMGLLLCVWTLTFGCAVFATCL